MNPDILIRYGANRLRVVRQLRYSLYNENAIDLVLFLNGIPVATAELKTDFTQSVEDAIDQYRQKPVGGNFLGDFLDLLGVVECYDTGMGRNLDTGLLAGDSWPLSGDAKG